MTSHSNMTVRDNPGIVVMVILEVVVLVLLNLGCAKYPAYERAVAQGRLLEAEQNGAYIFAPELVEAAKDSMEMAIKVIEVEDRKNMFVRDYSAAERLLISSEKLSAKAIRYVEKGEADTKHTSRGYKVISATTATDLEKRVNSFMSLGYSLVGGVVVNKGTYTQAMEKK